jgi:spore coat polysaccharide biosynthesis protein SpsF
MIVNIIIQARMGSSRFPGKVLADLHGKPILRHVLDGAMSSQLADNVIVAIPKGDMEGPLGHFLACQEDVYVHGGDEHDVAGRFLSAIEAYPCHAFVRICADSPYIAPSMVDALVYGFMLSMPAYLHIDCGIPGSNVELVAAYALRKVYPEMSEEEKEHVTLWFKNNSKSAVVDTEADLRRLNAMARP